MSCFADGSSLGCQGGDKCCIPGNKCGENEGDCDEDKDCQEGLKCGENNCPNKGTGISEPYPKDEWDATDDCCYNPTNGAKNFYYFISIIMFLLTDFAMFLLLEPS